MDRIAARSRWSEAASSRIARTHQHFAGSAVLRDRPVQKLHSNQLRSRLDQDARPSSADSGAPLREAALEAHLYWSLDRASASVLPSDSNVASFFLGSVEGDRYGQRRLDRCI